MLRRAALLRLLAALALLGWKALPGRTPAIRTGPDPIAALEPVEIGGMTQWRCQQTVLVRGSEASSSLRAGILEPDRIIAGIEGAPRWRSVDLDAQAETRRGDTSVIAYRATGHPALPSA